METWNRPPVAPADMGAKHAHMLQALGGLVCGPSTYTSIYTLKPIGDCLHVHVHAGTRHGKGHAERGLYVFFAPDESLRITRQCPRYGEAGANYPLTDGAELQAIVSGMRLAAEMSAKKNAVTRTTTATARATRSEQTLARLAALAQQHGFAYKVDVRSTDVLVSVRLDGAAVFELDVPHKTADKVLRALPKLIAAVEAAHGLDVFLRMRKVESTKANSYKWLNMAPVKKGKATR